LPKEKESDYYDGSHHPLVMQVCSSAKGGPQRLNKSYALDEDFVTAISLPQMTHIRDISLWRSLMSDRSLQALAASPYVLNLASLAMVRGYEEGLIGDEGVVALAGSPYLTNLRVLVLRIRGATTHRAIRALAASSNLRNLTSLELENIQIGDEGARALAASQLLSNLTSLELSHTQIGDEGARALAASAHLRNLTSLDLRSNQIGDEGAQALASCAHLSNLTSLNLCSNQIGAEGARALAASPHLRNLTSLDLQYNQIGEESAILLREHFGKRVSL
jgi:Ran GTPase-activating protein (RanGAP) involved in mRNA processing and transport